MKKQIAFKYKADIQKAAERLQLIHEEQDGTLNDITITKSARVRKEPVVNEILDQKISQILKSTDDLKNAFTPPKIRTEKVCGPKFISLDPFVRATRRYKCCWCVQFFSSLKEIRDHACIPVFICTDCEPHTSYKSRKALTMHLRIDHVCGNFKCSDCKFVSNTKTYLDRHISRVHKNSFVLNNQTNFENSSESINQVPQNGHERREESLALLSQSPQNQRQNKKRKFNTDSNSENGEKRGGDANNTIDNVLIGGTYVGDTEDIPGDVVNVAENLANSSSSDNDSIVDHSEDLDQRDSSILDTSGCFELPEFSLSFDQTSTHNKSQDDESESPNKKPLFTCRHCHKQFSSHSVLESHIKKCHHNLSPTPDSGPLGLPQPKRIYPKNEANQALQQRQQLLNVSVDSLTASSEAEEQLNMSKSTPQRNNNIIITHKNHQERMRDLLGGIKMEDTICMDKDRCPQCLRTQYKESSLEKHKRKCRGTFHLQSKVKCPFCKDPKRYFGTDVMLTHHIIMKHDHEQALTKWKQIKREKIDKEVENILNGGNGGATSG